MIAKVKHLQSWNEDKSHILIQLRSQIEDVQIIKNVGNGKEVKKNQVISRCEVSQSISNIIASEEGWLFWENGDQNILIASSSTFQMVGRIFKCEDDAKKYFTSVEKINNAKVFQEEDQQFSNIPVIDEIKEYNDKELKFGSLGNMYTQQFVIMKWKVAIGDIIHQGQHVGKYTSDVEEENYLVSQDSGQVLFLAPVDEQLAPVKQYLFIFFHQDETLIILNLSNSECHHLKIEEGRCMYCRKRIGIQQQDDNNCFPSWQLNQETIRKLAMEVISDTIQNQKKLILVLDLDLTILHTIRVKKDFDSKTLIEKENEQLKSQLEADNNQNKGVNGSNLDNHFNSFQEIKGFIKQHFLEMQCDDQSKFLIKLRPYYEQFFKLIIPLFDIYIYTKASRSYAKFILSYLQDVLGPHFENKALFPENRILSRDDTNCLDSKSLNRLFPPGLANNFMIILDDNPKMWAKFRQNLLPTKPFVYFFEGTHKDNQGISQDVETFVKIKNYNDFWLLPIAEHLRMTVQEFWDNVKQAQVDPKLIDSSSKQKKTSKSASKQQLQLKQQNEDGNSDNVKQLTSNQEQSLIELINERNIKVQTIYLKYKKSILKGTTLYFAISKQHSSQTQNELEQMKRLATLMGAKVYQEFRDSNFMDQNCMVVTHELKKIKSVNIAKEKGIKLIHQKWVKDCELFLERMETEAYDLIKYTIQQIEDDSFNEEITKKAYLLKHHPIQQQ